MISNKPLIDRINLDSLGTGQDTADIMAAAAAIDVIRNTVYSVPNLASLPSAELNTGRMIFVDDIYDYRYSDGLKWSRKFKSNLEYENLIMTWGCTFDKTGATVCTSSPIFFGGTFLDWCQVSAGFAHTAALRTNGTLWSWGCNSNGQLGDNSTVAKSSPVPVVGGFTDWCQVSSGNLHTTAVRTNGTLWAWGYNGQGRLGDGTITNRSSPVSVIGGFTDWCQVSAGCTHTTALRTNGTLWSWGYNLSGRLGDGTTLTRSSPVSVVGGFTDWCQVSAGFAHTAAVRQNGTLWSWGCNSNGRLGDNTTITKSSPVPVVGGFTDWCQVSASCGHTTALRTNGTLWSWGNNVCGRLGDNTLVSKSSPVSVVGGFTDWCQVSAGCAHTTAVRTNGTLWAWGSNGNGRLGDNTTTNRLSPVSVVGGFTDWCQVSANLCTVAIRKRPRGF